MAAASQSRRPSRLAALRSSPRSPRPQALTHPQPQASPKPTPEPEPDPHPNQVLTSVLGLTEPAQRARELRRLSSPAFLSILDAIDEAAAQARSPKAEVRSPKAEVRSPSAEARSPAAEKKRSAGEVHAALLSSAALRLRRASDLGRELVHLEFTSAARSKPSDERPPSLDALLGEDEPHPHPHPHPDALLGEEAPSPSLGEPHNTSEAKCSDAKGTGTMSVEVSDRPPPRPCPTLHLAPAPEPGSDAEPGRGHDPDAQP